MIRKVIAIILIILLSLGLISCDRSETQTTTATTEVTSQADELSGQETSATNKRETEATSEKTTETISETSTSDASSSLETTTQSTTTATNTTTRATTARTTTRATTTSRPTTKATTTAKPTPTPRPTTAPTQPSNVNAKISEMLNAANSWRKSWNNAHQNEIFDLKLGNSSMQKIAGDRAKKIAKEYAGKVRTGGNYPNQSEHKTLLANAGINTGSGLGGTFAVAPSTEYYVVLRPGEDANEAMHLFWNELRNDAWYTISHHMMSQIGIGYYQDAAGVQYWSFIVAGPVIRDVNAIVNQAFDETNKIRRENGKAPLERAPKVLQNYAMLRAKECDQLFSHDRPNGEEYWEYSQKLFVDGTVPLFTNSENIGKRAYMRYTGNQLARSFEVSEGHWNNMLDSQHEVLAIGYYENPTTRDQYIVQMFFEYP